MDDDLRDLLSAQIEKEIDPHTPRGLATVVTRGRRRRAVARVATSAVVVCVVAAGALAPRLPIFTSDDQSPAGRGGHAPVRTMPNGCPVSDGTPRGLRWTSGTARVAQGTFRGEPWVLCARTAESPGSMEETLCTNWRLGPTLSSGMDCVFSFHEERQVVIDETYLDAVMGPEDGYMFGAVPAGSVSVALQKAGGASVSGEIYAAPETLGVPFSFFTLFDEPYSEGRLVVRDEAGEVLGRRRMEHGLSQLFVDVIGEGTVVGYRTELLEIYEECRREGGDECRPVRPAWIACPPECTVGLADARITLVAEPAEGATFSGWSGDCSGTEPCELVVDRRRSVIATFAEGSS